MSLIITDSSAPDTILGELLIQDRPLETLEVLWAVRFWQKTGNPYFLDYVLTVCDTAQITIGPLLQAELVKAAGARLKGSPPGEAAQVHREGRTFELLTQMAHCTWKGMNQTKASVSVFDSYDGKKPALKTLYDYYTTFVKKTGDEKYLHAMFDEVFDQH